MGLGRLTGTGTCIAWDDKKRNMCFTLKRWFGGPRRVSQLERVRSRNSGVWSGNLHTWTLLVAVVLWRVGTSGIFWKVEEAVNLLIDWVPVPRWEQTLKMYLLDE